MVGVGGFGVDEVRCFCVTLLYSFVLLVFFFFFMLARSHFVFSLCCSSFYLRSATRIAPS